MISLMLTIKTINCLDLLAVLLMQCRTLLAFFAVRVHCWFRINLLPSRTPTAFSAEMVSTWLAPACADRTWHCLLLDIMRFHSAQSSSLSRFLQTAAQPRGVFVTPSIAVLSVNFLHCPTIQDINEEAE